ncbi:MAG: hypothetical protein ACP5KV_05055 [Candidatus Methanomethylicaceae archaeon]
MINIRKAKAFWFLKIPVYGVRGGIKVPIKPHGEFPNGKICESKILKRKDRYIAMLTFEFEARPCVDAPLSLPWIWVNASALQRCCGVKA